ncbi:uncharacterized protein cenpu isoform X2 [Eucyclogobius newberryi]|uniref:uncharacterized protein cenpu isoform X2 n=1 Tax=Eucyclogobius newberryi TaxID=166745 RepID=UPI003B5CB6C7
MGAKKGQKPQEPQQKNTLDPSDAGESSALATASFIEGLQQHNGAPLHSTALEEDLAAAEEEPVRRKSSERAAPNRRGNEKRSKPAPQRRRKTKTNKAEGNEAAKRKSSGDANAGPAKKQKLKSKRKTPAADKRGGNGEPQEASGGAPSPRSRGDVFTSDEELEESWNPSPKKRKGLGPKRSRTSSTDRSRKSSSGSERGAENVSEQKKPKRSGVTETEVALQEFLDFCQRYKATVESKAVKQALDCFASNVKEQLTEKICSSKRLKTVMSENSKLAAAIRAKRQRLLDAKNELIKSERRLWLQQKDKSELEQKLKDLSQSKTFLQNLRELNKRYLQHRRKNPEEKETYDASSLPALLIEAKHVQTTELQLKQINDRLQKKLKEK